MEVNAFGEKVVREHEETIQESSQPRDFVESYLLEAKKRESEVRNRSACWECKLFYRWIQP